MNIHEYISSGIVELYVLGLCSDEERAEVEQLRTKEPALDNAIIEFEEKLEIGLAKNQRDIPQSIDEKVQSAIQSLQTSPVALANSERQQTSWPPWLKLAIAACISGIIISLWFNYNQSHKIKNLEALVKATKDSVPVSLPASDYAVITNRSITPVAMYGVGMHSICRCTMFWDKATGKIYVMVHHLPKSSNGSEYQLWAMVNGNAVSVGMVTNDIRGRFIELANVPAGASSFMVTLEKTGGNAQPTLEQVYLKGSI
jgi:anti-sigma-K factor RskA